MQQNSVDARWEVVSSLMHETLYEVEPGVYRVRYLDERLHYKLSPLYHSYARGEAEFVYRVSQEDERRS